MARMTMKEWPFKCSNGHKFRNLQWNYEPNPTCKECGATTEPLDYAPSQSAAVHGDEIDILVKHGVCNPDGTPKRFTSKEDLKNAAWNAGYTVHGDTPKPNQRIVEQRHAEKEAREEKWRKAGA